MDRSVSTSSSSKGSHLSASLGTSSSSTGPCPGPQVTQECTTVMLRGLPLLQFDQEQLHVWLHELGFANQYDFLSWTSTSRRVSARITTSSAWINFRTPDQAKHFMLRCNGKSLQALPAARQGFKENFTYWASLSREEEGSQKPYLAEDSVAAMGPLSQLIREKVTSNSSSSSRQDTTLIIRNLPQSVTAGGQNAARQWLAECGFREEDYNFFLFIPAKRASPSGKQAAPYAFVNFRDARRAALCQQQLDRKVMSLAELPLSVVFAKVQGLNACRRRYGPLAEDGRLVAWVAPDVPPLPSESEEAEDSKAHDDAGRYQ